VLADLGDAALAVPSLSSSDQERHDAEDNEGRVGP
jgi:hypothetical protein